VPRRILLAPLLSLLLLLACACGLVPNGTGGASPPAGSLSASFIEVGEGDGVLVQAGGADYLKEAGRAEEGRTWWTFLEEPGRGVARWHRGHKSPQFTDHLPFASTPC
jgi:competence protein ComEC